jgi:hypothetical protein
MLVHKLIERVGPQIFKGIVEKSFFHGTAGEIPDT